jgi:hypothetical protein
MRVVLHSLAGRNCCPVCRNRIAGWKRCVRDKVQEALKRLCPHSHSYERTRHSKLWLDREQILMPGLRFLHFALEPGLERSFREEVGNSYVTFDIRYAWR